MRNCNRTGVLSKSSQFRLVKRLSEIGHSLCESEIRLDLGCITVWSVGVIIRSRPVWHIACPEHRIWDTSWSRDTSLSSWPSWSWRTLETSRCQHGLIIWSFHSLKTFTTNFLHTLGYTLMQIRPQEWGWVRYGCHSRHSKTNANIALKPHDAGG